MYELLHRPITIIVHILLFSILPMQVVAQSDVERAFEMQDAPVRSRLSVDREVKDAQSKVQSNVAERYIAKEHARAEEMGRLAANAKGSGTSGDAKYSCSVTCTGSWWASGSNVTVAVTGDSEDQARELAALEANPYCHKQSNISGVFKNTALSSGSAKCEKRQ